MLKPIPMDIAPRNGTIIRLLVEYDHSDLSHHPLEDAEGPSWTIGCNNFENDGEDVWRLAGWSWEQDCFCQSEGRPVGWQPFDIREPRRGLVSFRLEALIDDELWREYEFSKRQVVRIDEPRQLWVRRMPDGDAHQVIDAAGVGHVMYPGWSVMRRKTRAAEPAPEF